MITKVPGVAERVETGPLQFGDDWPGFFFRGDEALGQATMLEVAARSLPDGATCQPARHVMAQLAATLRLCVKK